MIYYNLNSHIKYNEVKKYFVFKRKSTFVYFKFSLLDYAARHRVNFTFLVLSISLCL